MTKLYAAIWEPVSSFGSNLIEMSNDASNIGIRWSLDAYGVDRIKYTIRTKNKYDRFYKLENLHANMAGVFSGWGYQPITGQIVGVESAGAGRIQLDIWGAGRVRLEDSYETTVPDETDTITATLEEVLTSHASAVSSDYDNIYTNSTQMGGVTPKLPIGDYPKDWIRKMLAMGDSSGNFYDFWLTDSPLNGMLLQQYRANYHRRNLASLSPAPTWQVYEHNTTEGYDLVRSIAKVFSDVTVYYGTITGTATSSDVSGVTLTDTGASFRTDGGASGDRVTNHRTGESATINDIASNTSLICSGLASGWSINDDYSIETKTPLSSQVTASPSVTYWAREWAEFVKEMDSTQAGQYRDTLLNTDSDEEQAKAFTISSRFVRSSTGTIHPVWEMIAQGGGYVQLMGLYEDENALTGTLNATNVFKITSLDYDHESGQMRVGVGSPDKRLDAVLAREGLLTGAIIQRGAKSF